MKNLANYNSPENIGTTHWFRTLTSQVKHMGEWLNNYSESPTIADEMLVVEYGIKIKNIMSDLIEWQETNQTLIQNLNEK